VRTCLPAKALLRNGCVYLLIKNPLPSSDVVARSLPSNGSTRYNTDTGRNERCLRRMLASISCEKARKALGLHNVTGRAQIKRDNKYPVCRLSRHVQKGGEGRGGLRKFTRHGSH
jgi:hypothetical protein